MDYPKVYLLEISIHAPARGATVFARFFSTLYTISIHAPARGATVQNQKNAIVLQFQSTLPRGERHGNSSSGMAETSYFNPRSREGSDRADHD